MASLPIHWIVARTYCQATEDEDKVVRALDAAASGGSASRDRVEGQFGNPVIVLVRRIERGEDVRATWERWRGADLIAKLKDDLGARLDADGILHLRIDKQAAFGGTLVPGHGGDVIDIQVKLKAYPANPGEIRKVATTLVTEAG